MNLIRRGTLVLAFLVIGYESPVRAMMMMRIDGAAEFRVIAIDRRALLCTRYVSGDKSYHFFALDPQTGAELWRCRSSNCTWQATVDGAMLYHETGGTLYKRILTNGLILWQRPLNSLPPHKVKLPLTFRFKRFWQEAVDNGRLQFGDTTPTQFGYQALMVTGAKLLIARSATAGGGCIIERCFEDWFLMDPATSKVLASGAGEYQGLVGPSAVFDIPDVTGAARVAFVIQQGERRNVQSLEITDGTRADLVELAASYRARAVRVAGGSCSALRTRAVRC